MVTIVVIRRNLAMSHLTGRDPAGTASWVRPAKRSSMVLLKIITVAPLELAGCLVDIPCPVMGWSPRKSALHTMVLIAIGKQMLMLSIATMPITCIILKMCSVATMAIALSRQRK